MARITHEHEINISAILSKKVGILGFGSQGHAHAQNLRDSGVDVRIGLREASASREWATSLGFEPQPVQIVSLWADVLVFAVPDVAMRETYEECSLRDGQALLFLHGFAIHYNLLQPPHSVDVVLVSPAGPGPLLRELFVKGSGFASLCAVAQDATGDAKKVGLAYAKAVGCARAGVIDTTFQEETETDLFGEQAVLCGGLPELIKAGFDTLVNAGYQPEIAYFECLHQVKLIADLVYDRGLTGMRDSISGTAEWGGYEAGPQVIGDATREGMQKVLAEIRSGVFAKRWLAEHDSGEKNLISKRLAEARLAIEEVGRDLRQMGK